MEAETLSTASSFISNMGGNILSIVLVGGGYLIYRVCGGSKCGYTTEHGFNIQFGEENHDDDSEDEVMKNIVSQLAKRKSIKIKKKLVESLSSKDKLPTIRIPIQNSPRFIDELKSEV